MQSHFPAICLALFLSGFLGTTQVVAGDAVATPKKQEQTEPSEKSLRVKYEIMIASHAFEQIEKVAKAMGEQYLTGKFTGDQFTDQLLLMLTDESKASVPDIIKWTEAYPGSYAAHYLLGVHYNDLARKARGGKFARETSEEQFESMHKYGMLARAALLKSLQLFPKPYPSYRSLIIEAGLLGENKAMDSYLKAAITIDPDAIGVYLRYFQYNTPRWGGTYAKLEKLVEEARQTGKMSRRNLASLDADLLVWRAIDETGLNKNPAGASDYYIAAYNAAPGKENIRYLHWAAHQANEAKQADKAIAIYTRIISEDKSNTNAYFQRGYLYHTEKENYSMALKDYLVAAEMGNMYAQNNVGYYYMTGKAGTKDLKLAREYLSKSAAQGFEHAKEKLKLLDSMQP